jgi:hypothetical protein
VNLQKDHYPNAYAHANLKRLRFPSMVVSLTDA